MQLSWPREGDRKRALISGDTRRAGDTSRPNVKRFLNSSPWDILLSEELENGRNLGEDHLRHTVKLHDANVNYLQLVSFVP